MRLKVHPEDFRVRELYDFEPDPRGEYYVHLLRKEKLDTLQALAMLTRNAGLHRRDVAFAGLKDRQGVTEQWITVRGRRADVRLPGLSVQFKGRTARPITSKQSAGNSFRVVLRELGERDLDELRRRVTDARAVGYPNYFDDQRFGSVKHGQGLVMQDVLCGRYEAALKSLIAAPSPRAISGDVKLKRLLQRNWGEWEVCARIARGPTWRRMFEVLQADAHDFRGALAALPVRLKLIHAYTWQSYVWNRSLSRWLRDVVPVATATEVFTELGRLRAWSGLAADAAKRLAEAETPLFGLGFADGDPGFLDAVDAVLEREQVTIEDVELHALPGMELRAEPRAARVVPERLRLGSVERARDGKMSAVLTFSLPRGSYATMLIKCLTAAPWSGMARRPTRRGPPPRARR